MLSCRPRNSVISGDYLGRIDRIHANDTPGGAWMSRRRVTCLISLDHAPFWPIGVHTRALVLPRYGEILGCRPRKSGIPGHALGRLDGMHANATPGAAWMSRHRLTCHIRLDHSPFWPIGVHSGHVDTPRCSWVCAGMKTNPQDRSGGLSDRPGVPTERLSRHISIGIDSYDTKGYYPSVLKWSSYIYSFKLSQTVN